MFRGVTMVKWSRRGGQAPIRINALWSGVVWALMTTIFIFAALALWVLMTKGTVYHFSGMIIAVMLLGALAGGIVSGKTAGILGLLHGFLVGMIYFIAIVSFLIAWNTGMPSLFTLMMQLLFVLLPAAIGGVIGVNLPGRLRNRPHNRLNYTARH